MESIMTDYNDTKAYKELRVILDDIKALKIQGATAVAVSGVKAFANYISQLNPDMENFIDHLKEIKHEIGYIRTTEPGLRNGLQFILNNVSIEMLDKIEMLGLQFEEILDEAKHRMADIGAARIQDGDTIFSHCHSSMVVGILRRAAEMGKKFEVIQTETRPKYQGRKTARELRKAGIKTTHVVDNAAWWSMNKFDVDMVLLGVDSITVEGVALNKIGSRQVALAADEMHIPLYHCTSLLKYDPETNLGNLAKIEMRDEEEVWSKKERPEGLKILNPAFDTIAREYISGYICEFGIVPPQAVFYVFNEKYNQFRRELY